MKRREKKHFHLNFIFNTKFSCSPFIQGVVYIQIIGWSKSLCMITEAHDNLRKFWILQNLSKILISWTGNQNNVCAFFATVFFMYHLILNFFPPTLQVKPHISVSSCVKRHLKHINVKCVENISRDKIELQNTCQ